MGSMQQSGGIAVRVKVVTDSSIYLDEKTVKELDITIVPLIVNLGKESYAELDLDYQKFFAQLPSLKVLPTTSQPSLQDIYQSFCRLTEEGNAVLAIFISSSLSGTYNTALLTRRMILEKYPEARIEVVDSRAACMGFMVLAAAKAAQEGAGLEEVLHIAVEKAQRSHFLFVPASLDYLAKGGRIGEAAALIGTMLNIKPVLALQGGQVIVKEKVRTLDKAFGKILEIMEADLRSKGLLEAGVGHVNNPQLAALWAKHIEKEIKLPVVIREIGPVLGLHLGPGTLGVGYSTAK